MITRNGKRSDVMMNAKHQAKANGVEKERWWELQQQAAQAWLEQQGQQHGFRLIAPEPDDFAMWAGDEYSELQAHCGCVQAYQQYRFVRKDQQNRSLSVALILAVRSVSPMQHCLNRLYFPD